MGHPPPAWAPEQHLPDHARSPPREQPLRGGGSFWRYSLWPAGVAPATGSSFARHCRVPRQHPPQHLLTPHSTAHASQAQTSRALPSPRPSTPATPLHPRLAPPQTLKKDLAGAIIDPQTTGFCLEQILTTTFVNSMDGTSLAF